MNIKTLALLLATLMANSVQAGLEMSKVFGDNMVLQRDIPVPVWGLGEPGEKVTVKFNGQEKTAIAGTDGKWIVRLDPLKASGEGQTMTISSSKITQSPHLQITNILVGDVWICSGQSNMEFPMKNLAKPEEETANADYPQIRLLSVDGKCIPIPQNSFGSAGWRNCSPKSVADFSAAGYFFGRKLAQELNVPIGLINCSWGGTGIEPWTPPEGFKGAELEQIRKMQDTFTKATIDDRRRIAEEFSQLPFAQKILGHYLKDGKPKDGNAVECLFLYSFRTKPTCIYNGMIRPLIPYAIKGVIWYQGESNASDMDYSEKQQALINSWRSYGAKAISHSILCNWLRFETTMCFLNSGFSSTTRSVN